MSGFFGGGPSNMSNKTPAIGAIHIQQSSYGAVISLVYGQTRVPGNLIWYGDFVSTAHTSQQASGGKGGGRTTNSTTSYTYKAAVAIGLCEGIVTSIPNVWAGKSQNTLGNYGFGLMEGGNPQSPWGYLQTAHPDEALGYNGLAYVAGAEITLDSSAILPAFNFEVAAQIQYGGGVIDAEPSRIILDFLTNPIYGAGFPLAQIGTWTSYTQYCVANSIFLSPAYLAQQPAATMLTDILLLTNSAVFFSEGYLKIRPYGDVAATAHGVTYTPDNTVWYNLNDDDFIYDSSSDPVICDRSDQVDAYNSVSVEIKNRGNQYNLEPIEAHDAGSVSQFGLRPMQVITAHSICDIEVGRGAAQRIMQRGLYIRNKYSFTLGWRYCLLEPMDIITITDEFLGLDHLPVRVLSIEEDEDGNLSFLSEEFPGSVSTNAVYPNQPTSGYTVNYGITPGNANAPISFAGPLPLSGNQSEIWIATSGSGVNYGGCEIWVADDNVNYVLKGRTTGSNRMGLTESAMTMSTDPDTTNTLSVDLSESHGTLSSGTQMQVDDGSSTLCYVGGEFITYRNATLTATSKYNLSYFRRGLYGSKNLAHQSGVPFVRVDSSIARIPLNFQEIGRVVYIKLRAFNQYGQGFQDLADVTAYTYVNQAPTAPDMDAVSGLELFNQGNNTVFTGQNAKFSWRANSITTSYDIGSEPYGGNSGSLGPYFRDYEVRIYTVATTPVLLRTEHTADTFYTYTYEKNFEDGHSTTNRTFTIKVYQRGAQGQLSSKPAVLTVSNPPPSAPTGVFATAGASLVDIGAAKPNLSDFLGMLVWSSTVTGFTPSDANKVYDGPNNSFTFVGQTPNIPLYFKLAFFDTFSKTVAQLNLSSEITATPFQSGIKIVTTLPVTGMVEGDVVYLTTDKQLWRFDGTAWTKAVTAAQVTGQLIDSQIAALAASKVTGQLSDSQLAAIAAAKITGQLSDAQLAAIAAAKVTGQITSTQITDGSISTPKLAAGSVTSSVIAAGTIVAGNISAGTITATELSSGSVTTAKIVSGAITTGTIAAGAITATEITSGAITTAKIATGAVDTLQLNAGAVTTAKITAGAITTALIQAGAVTANEIAVTTLSAISANLGTITAGSITSATYASASGSGQRITINTSSNNKLQVYNSSNVLITEIGGTSGVVYVPSTATLYPAIYATSTASSVSTIYGSNGSGVGVQGSSVGDAGVYGVSSTGYGVYGYGSSTAYGGYFRCNGSNPGLYSENFSTGHGARIRGGAGSLGSSAVIALSDGTNRCFYNELGTFGPFTGSHDAMLDKEDELEVGDIVVDVQCLSKNGISDTMFLVTKSTTQCQKTIIGVVNARSPTNVIGVPAAFIDREATSLLIHDETASKEPVAMEGWTTIKAEYDFLNMNALGEGQINVCGENGNIEAGDLITTGSLIPGKGMRQDDDLVHNYTVGKARESVTFSSPEEVKQIACVYICG